MLSVSQMIVLISKRDLIHFVVSYRKSTKKVTQECRLRDFRKLLEAFTCLTHIMSLLDFFFCIGAFRRASIAKRKMRSSSKLIFEFSLVACSTEYMLLGNFNFKLHVSGCESRELVKHLELSQCSRYFAELKLMPS